MFKLDEKLTKLVNKYLGNFKFTPALAAEAGISVSKSIYACNGCDGGCTGGCWGCEGGCAGASTRR